MNTKRIFATMLVLLMISMLLMVPVEAADLTSSFTYENEKLTITGSNAPANGLVSIYILKSTVDINTVSDSVRPAVVDAVLANATGGYTAEILLPSDLGTDQYKIHIASGANTWESAVFNHINSGELSSLLFNVNHSSTASEIEGWLNPLNIALELPDVTYTSEYLYAVRPAGGFTDTQLQTQMQRSSALHLLQQGETPENLVPYEPYLKDSTLQIDCLTQYKNMTTDVRTGYLATVSTMNLKTTSALEDLYGAGLIENVKVATSWQDLQNTVQGTTGGNAFFTNKIAANSNYINLIYPELVYQELYRQKTQLTDMVALKNLFATTSNTLYTNQQNAFLENSGNQSSGVGDGGFTAWGPSASEVVKPQEEITKPEKEENTASVFHDISGHWAEAAIKQMATLGVASGYADGSFCPDAYVSRAEYVKLLCELFQLDAVSNTTFADVPADAWYAPYVETAKAFQIVQGDENGKFHPNATITRQDAAVMLGRFLKLNQTSVAGKFTDETSIASYALGYVAAMADMKLINGMADGSYAPLDNTTRAQTVTLLLNAKNWVDNGRNGG